MIDFKVLVKPSLAMCLWLSSTESLAFSEPCQLVAQMAGTKNYEVKPLRLASLSPQNRLNPDWRLQLVDSHGAWFIYQTEQPWLTKEQCAPLQKSYQDKSIEFSPVLLNKQTGHHAVIGGNFIIKVYKSRDLAKVIEQYKFIMLTPLPNPKSAIVDVKPTDSYDLLIKRLDNDRNIDLAMPILNEP